MLTNYLKMAVRIYRRNKVNSTINVFGLAIGMAVTILIMLWVQDELSFDKFHEHADQIYRITGHDWAQTQVPLSTALREFYPEIINTVRIGKVEKVLLGYDQKKFYEENVIFSDPSIFDVFSFPLLIGDQRTALSDPYSVVITEEAARKYFGDQSPIGKKLNYDDKNDYQVTGVLKSIPRNSHLKFDFYFFSRQRSISFRNRLF